MELLELVILAVVIGLIVGAITWFGPRRGQWRSHDLKPTEEAQPLSPLADTSPEEDAGDESENEL